MSIDKKPNFFILGAPKCGTTAMAEWISTHPEIFMCDPKEPHYFNTDSDHHGALNLEHYESFFSGVHENHKAIGEGSVWYLASSDAVKNILSYQPEAKFLVFIRNPLEMAPSLHDQKKFSGDENIQDFESAWKAQTKRRNGEMAYPKSCVDIKHLMYGESCKLGSMLQRLFQQVDRDKVLVVLMDDIKSDAKEVYQNVLRFLEVEDDGRSEFPVINPAKERRLPWVRKILRHLHLIKTKLGMTAGTGIGAIINKWNLKERQRPELSSEIKREMLDYFEGDISLLESLLNRDLSDWRKL